MLFGPPAAPSRAERVFKMSLPNLTHAEIAHAFVDIYGNNFKAFRTYRNTIEVWAKVDGRRDLVQDVKRYYLHRSIRSYLDWIFEQSPEPKPLKLQSHGFLAGVMREVIALLYVPEGIL